MADPIMLAAVTALVTWTTTELATGGRVAVSSLMQFLRQRFRPAPDSAEVLEGTLTDPTPARLERLAEMLEREASRDPSFGAELRARLTRTGEVVRATSGDVANVVSGDVHGPVVQARDIHGGISFGSGEAPL